MSQQFISLYLCHCSQKKQIAKDLNFNCFQGTYGAERLIQIQALTDCSLNSNYRVTKKEEKMEARRIQIESYLS